MADAMDGAAGGRKGSAGKAGLSAREYVAVASMLFGLFFGAGNLIFPIHMGQLAGANVWPAIAGFIVTGVGIPILAVAALGMSRSDGLLSLASKVGGRYGYAFTCLLYLTIGPFFAIPRCATVAYTVGVAQVLPQGADARLGLLLFSAAFFAIALALALRPGKILTWVGKVLTPAFLIFLGILVVAALVAPTTSIADVEPAAEYAAAPFSAGLLEGYNTMDALAGLAFGIVVVNVIRDLGVEDPAAVAGCTARSGVLSGAIMAAVYVAVCVVGAQSRGALDVSDNGGIAFAQIARLYLGDAGLLVLAATVTLACLKTSVGLITSCSEAFVQMFSRGADPRPSAGKAAPQPSAPQPAAGKAAPQSAAGKAAPQPAALQAPSAPQPDAASARRRYRAWAVAFTLVSLLFANWGLDAIIAYAVPVLMFLYPLAMVLIALALAERLFGGDRRVFAWTSGCTLVGSAYGMLAALPEGLRAALHLDGFIAGLGSALPFSALGYGWACPALAGLAIGICAHVLHKRAAVVQ